MFSKKLFKIHELIFDENSPEFHRISAFFTEKTKNLWDSQISWDFATEIVDFFQKMIFQKLDETLENKLELEQNPF